MEGGPPVSVVVGVACVLAVLASALIWLSQENALPPGAGYEPASTGGRQDGGGPRRAAMTDTPALRIDPPAFLAEPALAAVMAALPEARVVGGAVRDALAGRAVADVDLATPRTPEQVTAGAAGGRHARRADRAGPRHGDGAVGRARLRGHHAAARRRDRRPPCGRRVHR